MFPYDYNYLINYPTELENLSLWKSENRNEIKFALQKNISKNVLNINYWNYNLVIDNFSKNTNDNFEISFINLYVLTKKNQTKNLDLKKYFLSNYKKFSDNNKKYILKNY